MIMSYNSISDLKVSPVFPPKKIDVSPVQSFHTGLAMNQGRKQQNDREQLRKKTEEEIDITHSPSLSHFRCSQSPDVNE